MGNQERVKVFGYSIKKIEEISSLPKYKDHRRLRVYFHKGTECVNPGCDRKGEILVHGMDKMGNIHIDLCTRDLYPITVDHIKPRSLGGSDDLENLQPMCSRCNTKKGNGLKPKKTKKKLKVPRKLRKFGIEIGDEVFKRTTNNRLGVVSDIIPNPHHPNKILSATIEGRNKKSMYPLKSLYSKNVE